jgi:hypothetical protein
VGVRDLSWFLQVQPLRLASKYIHIKSHVESYLNATFYNHAIVLLHNWKVERWGCCGPMVSCTRLMTEGFGSSHTFIRNLHFNLSQGYSTKCTLVSSWWFIGWERGDWLNDCRHMKRCDNWLNIIQIGVGQFTIPLPDKGARHQMSWKSCPTFISLLPPICM